MEEEANSEGPMQSPSTSYKIVSYVLYVFLLRTNKPRLNKHSQNEIIMHFSLYLKANLSLKYLS